MLDSDSYDVVVLGTGLAESIAAAALAKAGHSVLHLDPNEYYGGEQASLTLDELVAWCDVRSGAGSSTGEHGSAGVNETDGAASTSASTGTEPGPGPGDDGDYIASQKARYTRATSTGLGTLGNDRRRYALTLYPALMLSRGTLVSTLIDSDVSKYVGFRLLDGISVYDQGEFHRVPGAKEDVFKDKSIALLDKRRLMKALMFAGGEFEQDEAMQGHEADGILAFLSSAFSLSPRLATALTYAVAHASSPAEPALPALQRARKYLRSIGRYGPSAFLVGQYGGAGEVAQGFCRACAVFGGTYVLGPEAAVSDLAVSSDGVSLRIKGHPRAITAKHVIATPDFLPAALQPAVTVTSRTAHAVVVVTQRPGFLLRPKEKEKEGEEEAAQEEQEEEADDTAVLVLPPTDGTPFVRALIMGEGTGSCPAGQYVVYFWTADGSTDDLKAQVARLEGVAFEAYYVREARGFEQPPQETEKQQEKGEGEAKEDEDKEGDGAEADAPAARKSTLPLVVLNPYAGAHMLTEGLDWEAAQAARAFAAVSDRVFFERSEEDEDVAEE